MRRKILLDTGPLVALLNTQDQYHVWTKTEVGTIEQPFLSCEAVMMEACFLLRRLHGGEAKALALLARGIIQVAFRLETEVDAVNNLMNRYRSVPMSLADACLVRMAEVYTHSPIMPLDKDFRIYRKAGKEIISVIMPDGDG